MLDAGLAAELAVTQLITAHLTGNGETTNRIDAVLHQHQMRTLRNLATPGGRSDQALREPFNRRRRSPDGGLGGQPAPAAARADIARGAA